jgi:hypothetical protein
MPSTLNKVKLFSLGRLRKRSRSALGLDTESPGLDVESPCNDDDLENLVFAQKLMPSCDCDICAPKLYGSSNCHRAHAKMSLHKHLEQSKCGYAVYAVPKLVKGSHELMELARGITTYMDRPWEHLNDTQRKAKNNLYSWLMHPGLGVQALALPQEGDGDALVTERELQLALTWINELFFGGDIPGLTVRWTRAEEDEAYWKARNKKPFDNPMTAYASTADRGDPEIVMFADRTGDKLCFGSYHILKILSVLIHEAIHVFLGYYGCRHCKTFASNNDFLGHGRAWQLVAVQLEETFPRLLGIPLDLGRSESMFALWKDAGRLPSPHDLVTYKLHNRYIASQHDEDVFSAAYSMLDHVLYMPLRLMEAQGDLRIVAKEEETKESPCAAKDIGPRVRPWAGAEWTEIELAHESYLVPGMAAGRKMRYIWKPRKTGTSVEAQAEHHTYL